MLSQQMELLGISLSVSKKIATSLAASGYEQTWQQLLE